MIERELGRGGMGVVYEARQVGLNRPVALKMIPSGEHAEPRELVRFLAEADGARRRYPKDWRVQFLLGRAFAVMAAAEPAADHADAAAGCLRAAIDAGLPDRPPSKWEPDLDPVRSHNDVAAALGRLKAVEVLPPPRAAVP